ncbi:MAG TPA: DMT family transporter [Burkholderiales bacterium]|jgi:drug/metabolite transporter (DMT)-like permease|nr:DMT family transporter [Burkholderiales bacterium]
MSAVIHTGGAAHDRSGLAVVSLLVAGLLWGLTWIPIKYFGSQGLNGITLTMMSYGLVGILALPWILHRRGSWWPQRNLVLIIAITGGLANVCFLSAIVRGEVVRVMLLFYLAPVWGVLGGRIFFGERLTRLRLLGVAIAVIGAVLLLGGPAVLAAPPGVVDLLALASGMLYASQNIVTRAADRTPLDAKALVVFVGCGLMSGALVLGSGQPLAEMPPVLLGQLFVFAGVWMLSAMVVTAWGVSRLEAGRAAILLVFELVAAVVSAMWIAGERLDGLEWAGAAMIVGAALLEARSDTTGKGPRG